MASGSNSTTLTSSGTGGRTNLLISWNENSTSTANNTSNITVTAKMTYNTAVWDITNSGTLYAYWHDNHDNYDRLVAEVSFNELGYGTNTRQASGTINATHNNDGKLSGYAFARWTQKNNYGGYAPSSGDCRAPSSGWTKLTEIARKATVTSVQNFNDEDNPVLTYENKAGNTASTLQACICKTDGSTILVAYRDIPKTGTSYTFELTSAERETLRNAIPNDSSLTVRFYIKTVISSNTFYDYKESTFSIVNGNPTFTNFTYADTNSTITAVTGNNQVLVSGKSTLRATIASANKAVANKGASMSTYTFSINGATSSEPYSTSDINKDLGTVTLSTNETTNTTKSLVVSAVDSRGINTPVTKDITVLPYTDPVVNASATRLNGFENETTFSISGSFSILSVNGTSKNTVNSSTGVQYRYKSQSTTTWGSWTPRTATVDTTNGTVTVANFTINLDNQTAYDVEVKITDSISSTTKSLVVSMGQPQFFIGTDGRVSVGGMPTVSKDSGNNGQFEVLGNAYANGKRLATIDEIGSGFPVGSIYMSVTMTTAAQVEEALGGTWVAWGAGRVPVGIDTTQTEFDTVEETGGEKTHTLTTSEIPAHSHPLNRPSNAPNAVFHSSVDTNHWFNVQGSGDGAHPDAFQYANPTVGNNTGGGGAHNNLQPYITCYMYKRTA